VGASDPPRNGGIKSLEGSKSENSARINPEVAKILGG